MSLIKHLAFHRPIIIKMPKFHLQRWLTLNLLFYQVVQTALWTSGIPSTRSACVSFTGTQPASPRWPSTTMAPCSPLPLPTCTRRETSATQRMPSSSAKSQTLKPSPSEWLSPLLASWCGVLLFNESLSSCFYREHVQLKHMLIYICVRPLFNIRQLRDGLIENVKVCPAYVHSVTRQIEACSTL